MRCDDFRERVQDWLDGALPAAEAARLRDHAAACPRCAAIERDYRLLTEALGGLPAPEPPPRLTERLVRGAAPAPSRGWRAAAVAATVVLAIAALPWLGRQAPVGAGDPAAVRLVVDGDKTVSLSLASEKRLDGVTLTLVLPEHVELQGYPHERRLSWRTDLSAGENRLRLPLHARRAGSGELVARIEHGGKSRELRLRLDSVTPDHGRRHTNPTTRLAAARASRA
ncbi:putative transmembrane anti-sigma factor [Salinisphaera sp. PC39]|uniref:anti-sigma factor family protein n=1 Tax=Salinisphaera sp. PC39 TaxID=1304156 RepID=UPI003340A420